MQFNPNQYAEIHKKESAYDLTLFSTSTSSSSFVPRLPTTYGINMRKNQNPGNYHLPNMRPLYEYDIPSTMMISNNILNTELYNTQTQESMIRPFMHRNNTNTMMNLNKVDVEVEPILSSNDAISTMSGGMLKEMTAEDTEGTKDTAALILNKRVKTRKRNTKLEFSSTEDEAGPVNKLRRKTELNTKYNKALLVKSDEIKKKAANVSGLSSSSAMSSHFLTKPTLPCFNPDHTSNVSAMQLKYSAVPSKQTASIFVESRMNQKKDLTVPVKKSCSTSISTTSYITSELSRLKKEILVPALPPMHQLLKNTHKHNPTNQKGTDILKPVPLLNTTRHHHLSMKSQENDNTSSHNIPNTHNTGSDDKYKKETNTLSNPDDTNLKMLAKVDSVARTNYLSLVSFKEKYGNCNVPYLFPENPILGHWVSNQRYQYNLLMKKDKRSTISVELKTLLDNLGFEWDAGKAIWDETFWEVTQALKLKESTISSISEKEKVSLRSLNEWLVEQRNELNLFRQGEKSELTALQAEKLMSLGSLVKKKKKNYN